MVHGVLALVMAIMVVAEDTATDATHHCSVPLHKSRKSRPGTTADVVFQQLPSVSPAPSCRSIALRRCWMTTLICPVAMFLPLWGVDRSNTLLLPALAQFDPHYSSTCRPSGPGTVTPLRSSARRSGTHAKARRAKVTRTYKSNEVLVVSRVGWHRLASSMLRLVTRFMTIGVRSATVYSLT